MLMAQLPEVCWWQLALLSFAEEECAYSKVLMIIDVLPGIVQKHRHRIRTVISVGLRLRVALDIIGLHDMSVLVAKLSFPKVYVGVIIVARELHAVLSVYYVLLLIRKGKQSQTVNPNEDEGTADRPDVWKLVASVESNRLVCACIRCCLPRKDRCIVVSWGC